jgi:tripartite-type tricarboxylate transporter receptor subunit TctC
MKTKSSAIALASLLLLGTISAHADTYPSRTISMVVPFPAGGPSDVIARIVAAHMSKTLGQTIIIENVGGAGGTIGSARVAAATPDGYTLLAGSMGSHVAAPALFPNLRYDSTRDFVPIGLTAVAPVAIVARKDFPAKDMRGFIDYLKSNGETVRQAHGGIGSSSHMACLLFTSQFGLKPKLVPYRGTGPAVNDLAGGHVDFLCEQVVSVAPQVTGGLIKAYGVTGNARAVSMPDVPTMAEAGFLQFEMSIWSGLWAPKGTSTTAVATLSGTLDKALDDPEVQKKMSDLGGSVPPKNERSSAFFADYLKKRSRVGILFSGPPRRSATDSSKDLAVPVASRIGTVEVDLS